MKCLYVRAHTHTHTVYLIPAGLALSTPALPLLQQLANIVSPLGMMKGREKRRRRRGCSVGEEEVKSESRDDDDKGGKIGKDRGERKDRKSEKEEERSKIMGDGGLRKK